MIKKVRAQQIKIDLPTEESAIWVNVVRQTVIKDGAFTSVQSIDRTGYTNRTVSQFATNMITVIDPITQQPVTVSGAGIAALVKRMVGNWLIEDCNGEWNGDNIIIKE